MAGLAYPAADVLGVAQTPKGVPPDVIVSVMGLTGPSGVLPRSYTETLNATLRTRSSALHDFLDMLSHRMVALFARAGTKYRPSRIAEMSAAGRQGATIRSAMRCCRLPDTARRIWRIGWPPARRR